MLQTVYETFAKRFFNFNPIEIDSFWGLFIDVGPKGPSLPNFFYTYPTIKPGTVTSYLKKIKRYTNHSRPYLISTNINIASAEISNICYTEKKQVKTEYEYFFCDHFYFY